MITLLIFFVTSGSEEEVQALERGGNKIVNAIFESKIAYDHPRPDVNSHSEAREKFCTEKYVQRLFFSESKCAKIMKTADKPSSGRFALRAAGKDTASSGRNLSSNESQKGFNSSDSSFGDLSFGDQSFGDEAAPDEAMGALTLYDADQKRPRQRVRSRRRGSVGGTDPNAPKAPPSRAMSLQVDATAPNMGRRAARPGRRNSVGRTSSLGGAPLALTGEGQQGEAPRPGRRGRRGSVGGGAPPNPNNGSSSNLEGAGGSNNSLKNMAAGGGEGRQRRAGRKAGGALSTSNHGGRGADPLGGSSHGGRRRPQRRGSVGVEESNAKLNEKREMVW